MNRIHVGVFFAISLFVLGLWAVHTTAQSSEQTTPSNVTILEYVAIGLSTDLADGIRFGMVNPGTNDNNATKNYVSGNTTYYIEVSDDGNINVDICVKDNAPLTDVTQIPNSGYTWNDSQYANTTDGPQLPGTSMSTGYVKGSYTGIPAGGKDYFRFWLDIPPGQAAGQYNNTIYFEGVEAGTSC